MSRLGRTHHLRTEGDGRALQAEADAERRNTALGRFPRERRGAPGDLRPPRARRDHEPIDPRVERARQRGIVRAKDADVGAQRTKRLRQVVGEGVVVIDDQNATTRTRTSARLARRPSRAHVTAPPSTSSIARSSARALARVSASSAAGFESATMPAPAWMRQTPSAMTAVRIVIAVSRRPSKPT